ncbi:anthrone oxygenase family protein [Marinobacter sp. NFXS9]|uniref:anthrone oxygenase family protein n=1 Tax=Marinobacter sp. NFXS9 TaxID=2818433 RepID=UPI0032DEF673
MSFVMGLTVVTAMGCGLIAGLFFAFSVAVMDALGQLAPSDGVAAMQRINRVIVNPLFLGVFFGTGALCLALMMIAVPWRGDTVWLVLGGVLYLVGSLGITLICNVPLNNRLARVPADSLEADIVWADYRARWTRWNHVRTVSSLLASASLVLGV